MTAPGALGETPPDARFCYAKSQGKSQISRSVYDDCEGSKAGAATLWKCLRRRRRTSCVEWIAMCWSLSLRSARGTLLVSYRPLGERSMRRFYWPTYLPKDPGTPQSPCFLPSCNAPRLARGVRNLDFLKSKSHIRTLSLFTQSQYPSRRQNQILPRPRY